jgi:pectate lyase
MKSRLVWLSTFLFAVSAQALLLEDHFDYNNGSLGGSGVGSVIWTAGDSPSAAIIVTNTAALTNASLAGIVGKGVQMSGGTFKKRDAPFASQSSGAVYVSFLLNIQVSGTGTGTFLYLHDSTSATSSPELGLFLHGNDIGIGKKVNAPAAQTTLSAGTHFIVASYSFESSPNPVSLWVDPTTGTSNPPSATLTTTSGSDGTALAVCFLNHSVNQTIYVDELRIGTSWAEVTPTTGAPPPPPSIPTVTEVFADQDGLNINGVNGPAHGDYDVVASTNFDLPVSQWPVIATDSFDANGNFRFVNSIAADVPQKFYAIRVNTNAPGATPPVITGQPQDTTNLVGNSASFTVAATGTAPLFYQWYFNASNLLTGKTSNTLTLNNIQFSDAGGYSTIVSNNAGSVTSVVAQLVVTNIATAPFILTQPQDQTVTVGQTANFSVTAGGSMPLSYQWNYTADFSNYAPLQDETNATLSLPNITAGDAGGYSVTVSNDYGETNSVTAVLAVNTNAPPNFAAIGFCNDGVPITGGTNGPVVYVGSEAQLQMYSDVNPPYTIYITNSFNLTAMNTHIRSNKTVIGVGNVVLTGGGLYLYRSKNVIIRNLTIVGSSEDNIGIHYSDHIWIDHCTLKNSTDGNIDITQASDYITISWCKFQYDSNNGHDFVNLIASSDSDNGSQYHVTFHHNWWSTLCTERMPSVRFGRVHCFNNYYNAPGNNYCIRTRVGAELRIENNFFTDVQNPWEQYITGAGGTQGKAWASGNNVPFLGTAYGVTWTGTKTNSDATIRVVIPGTDTVFTPPYSYTLDNALEVKNIVIENSGAGQGPFAP